MHLMQLAFYLARFTSTAFLRHDISIRLSYCWMEAGVHLKKGEPLLFKKLWKKCGNKNESATQHQPCARPPTQNSAQFLH